MTKLLSLVISIIMILSTSNLGFTNNKNTDDSNNSVVPDDSVVEIETTPTATATDPIPTATEKETTPTVTTVQSTIKSTIDGHQVTISGMLPKNATLSLTAVNTEKAETLAEQMNKDGVVFACDIKILDEYGNEWQPDEKVSFNISNLDLNDYALVDLLHLSGNLDEALSAKDKSTVVETDKDLLSTDGEISTTVEGFSIYIATVTFTVDFHYNDITYNMPGMSDMLLSELFTELGIDKDATTATNVVFSDTSLVSVAQQKNKDWMLTSHKAFVSEETLKITFSNGEKLTIEVTDAATYSLGGKTGFESVNCSYTASSGETLIFLIEGNFELNGSSSGFTVANGGKICFYLNTTGGATIGRGTLPDDSYFIKCNDGGSLTIRNEAKVTTDNLLCIDGRNWNNDTGSVYTDDANKTHPEALVHCTSNDNSGGELYFRGVSFQNSICSGSGNTAGVTLNGDRSSVKFINCKFTNLKSNGGSGGGLKYAKSFKFTGAAEDNYISGCTFTNCDSENNGGGIYIQGNMGKGFRLLSTKITTCNAPEGSAIYFAGDTVSNNTTFSSCTIDNNDTTSDGTFGGAIRTAGPSTLKLTITNSTIMNNASNGSNGYGGGIYWNASGTNASKLTLNNVSIHDNKAKGYGGGIYCEGLMAVNGCSIYNNTAENGGGIAQLIYSNGDTTVVNPDNELKIGIYGTSDRSTIYSNTATKQGGGIYLWARASSNSYVPNNSSTAFKLTLNDVNVRNNTAGTSGGGIAYNADTTKYTKAITINSGANIYSNVAKGTNNTFTSTAVTGGGGIYLTGSSAYIKVNDGTLYSNTATSSAGGAILISGSSSHLNMVGGTIGGSSAKANSAKNGGGVAVAKGCYISISGGDVSYNEASAMGGGFYAYGGYSGNEVTVSGGDINNNTAGTNGGGVYAYQSANFSMSKGNIQKNTAGSNGGGVFAHTSCTMTLSGGNIQNNTATATNGGGVYLNSSTCTVTSGNISSNKATAQNGGGVFATTSSTFKMSGGNVQSNTAGAYGGGVYSIGSTCTISSGNISKNTANQVGGGIAAFSQTIDEEVVISKVTITGGNIDTNTSTTGSGGGVYANNSTVSVKNAEINNNTAGGNGGGIFANNPSTIVTIQTGSKITNNNSSNYGGGIYLTQGATATMSGGEVSGNTSAIGAGIGAYLDNATEKRTTALTMSGGSIKNNTASDKGGGVALILSSNAFSTSEVKVTLSGSSITGNKATTHGGGVAVINGGSDVTKATLAIGSGSISSNTSGYKSAGNGGGVYCDGGTVTVTGGNINDNTATNGGGGGIFAYNGGKVTVSDGFIRYNVATGSNDETVAYDARTSYAGIGGGVCIGKGNSSTSSSFVLTGEEVTETDPETGVTSTKMAIGIYQNQASFAADDVYSYGVYTDLDVPKFQEMTLDGFTGKGKLLGWFEDYANNDVSYTSGTDLNPYVKTGARYSTSLHPDPAHEYKIIIEDVDTGSPAVNNADTYVAMTLGIESGGFLSVTKEVVDSEKFDANSIDDTQYIFKIQKFTDAGMVDLTAYEIAEVTYTKTTKNDETLEGQTLNEDSTFTLGGGESAFISGLPYGSFTVKELLTGQEYEAKVQKSDSVYYQKGYADSALTNDEETGLMQIVNGLTFIVNYTNTLEPTPGYLKVSKTVVDYENNINDTEETEYKFQILKFENGRTIELTAEEISAVTYSKTDKNGEVVENQKLAEKGIFTLVGGDTVFISGLPATEYIVKELLTGEDYNYKVGSSTNEYYREGIAGPPVAGGEQTAGMKVINGRTTVVSFTNTLAKIDVNVKYFNRDYYKIVNGEPVNKNGDPVDIDKVATTYTKAHSVTKPFVAMISDTAFEVNGAAELSNNILDDYICYTSQASALAATGKEKHSSQYNKYVGDTIVLNGVEQTISEYDGHTENWVTYYDANGKVVEVENNPDFGQSKIASITVWLRNVPKEYTYNVYQAKDYYDLTDMGDGKFVAQINELKTLNTNDEDYSADDTEGETGNDSKNIVYYNQRFGIEYHSGSQNGDSDESTNYLKNYGKKAWLTAAPDTAEVITDDEHNEYYFSYWAFDPEGTQIASTERLYPYRITGNLTLYAVYEAEKNTNIGLSVNKGVVDKYTDGGTEKTAINTIMNPYNCEKNDTNIKNVGVIYVIDSKGNVAQNALDLYGEYTNADGTTTTNLDKIREVIQAKLTTSVSKTTDTTVQLNLSAELSALGITKGSCRVYYVSEGTVLTNRNRVQFTERFTTASLQNRRIYAFATMYYAGNLNKWIVSDNCIDYRFDEKGEEDTTLINDTDTSEDENQEGTDDGEDTDDGSGTEGAEA